MTSANRDVLIIGATGAVGSELTRLYAADGHRVHAVGRNPARLAALAERTGARTYRADLADEQSARHCAEQIAPDSSIGLAIAAVGGWYVAERGLELAIDRWTSTLESNLTAHFVAARSFANLLGGTRPTYLALNGIAGHYPCEGSLAISVAGAGQRMMLDVLAAEGRDEPMRFAELYVDTPILMPGQTHDNDEPTHTIAQVYAAIGSLQAADTAAGEVLRRHLG